MLMPICASLSVQFDPVKVSVASLMVCTILILTVVGVYTSNLSSPRIEYNLG